MPQRASSGSALPRDPSPLLQLFARPVFQGPRVKGDGQGPSWAIGIVKATGTLSLGPSCVQMKQRPSLDHCQPGGHSPVSKHDLCFTTPTGAGSELRSSFGRRFTKRWLRRRRLSTPKGGAAIAPGFLLLQKDKSIRLRSHSPAAAGSGPKCLLLPGGCCNSRGPGSKEQEVFRGLWANLRHSGSWTEAAEPGGLAAVSPG